MPSNSHGVVSDGMVSDGMVSDCLVFDSLASDGLASDGLGLYLCPMATRIIGAGLENWGWGF